MFDSPVNAPKQFKPYIIRKGYCGHWCVFKCDIEDVFIAFEQIGHFETFEDVLVYWNLVATDYI